MPEVGPEDSRNWYFARRSGNALTTTEAKPFSTVLHQRGSFDFGFGRGSLFPLISFVFFSIGIFSTLFQGCNMPIPRKRSCAQCRLAKTRCSLDAPKCTRCRSRSLQCDYSEALPRATVGEGHANTRFWSNTPISQVEQATPLPSEFLMETDSTFPLQWAEPNFSDVLFNDDEPWIEYTHEESVPLQQPELRHQQPNQMHVYMQLEADQQTLGYLNDVSQRLLNNDTLCASWSPDRIPAQFKTLLCRKPTENLGRSLVNTHILKTFRIYPSMLAKSTFPPFIHKYCAAKDYTRLLLEDNFRLLEPLANCMAFIPMFRSRIPGSTKFIHRTLFAEAQRLHSEVRLCQSFSSMPLCYD